MLTNRIAALLVATFAFSVSASNADAQVANRAYYPSAGIRYSPAGWNNVPRVVNTNGTRGYCAPCNTGCANGVCTVPGAVGSPYYGGAAPGIYRGRTQPVYYRVPTYRPVITYPSGGSVVPGNTYRAPVPAGYGRPVIINTPSPAIGGVRGPVSPRAPVPGNSIGRTDSPFYP